MIQVFLDNVSIWLRWGSIFWYTTFGIIIAITGIFVRNPIFKFPFQRYVRSALVGGWFNFTGTFLTMSISLPISQNL